jgi:hypothetical protein
MRLSVWMSPLGLFAIGLVCLIAYAFNEGIRPDFWSGVQNASSVEGQNKDCKITIHYYSSHKEWANCKFHLTD